MKSYLSVDELEQTFSTLAEAIDAVGREEESRFLAKLVLLLAQEIGDVSIIRACIAEAKRHL